MHPGLGIALLLSAMTLSGCQTSGGVEPCINCNPVENGGPESEWQDWPMHGGGPAHTNFRNIRTGITGTGWNFSTTATFGATSSVSGLALSEGILVVSTTRGPVYAINASDGKLLWAHGTFIGTRFPPIIASSMVLVAQNSTMHALDLRSGGPVWNFTAAPFEYEPGYFAEQRIAQPAVANGLVIFGTSGPTVFGLILRTGELEWSKRIPESPTDADSSCPITVLEGTVLVCSDDADSLFAVNLRDGKHEWSYTVPASNFPPPGIWDGTAIVSQRSHLWNLAGLDLKSGKQFWNATLPNDVSHSPVIDSKRAYVHAGDNKVHAVRIDDGGEVWRFGPGSDPGCGSNRFCEFRAPGLALASNGTLFVSGVDGTIYVLQAETGQLVASYDLSVGDLTAPLLAADGFFVGRNEQVFGMPYGLPATP